MRRFFHRKSATARAATPTTTPNGPILSRSRSSSSSSPVHSTAAGPTGRVRAPALRSRSMSVLNGPGPPGPSRRFTRSLSFCAENHTTTSNSSCFSRQLTESEEDEVFRSYTRRVYGLFGVLGAFVLGFVVYAYYYNYGNR